MLRNATSNSLTIVQYKYLVLFLTNPDNMLCKHEFYLVRRIEMYVQYVTIRNKVKAVPYHVMKKQR
jgi:hypothetical protein